MTPRSNRTSYSKRPVKPVGRSSFHEVDAYPKRLSVSVVEDGLGDQLQELGQELAARKKEL